MPLQQPITKHNVTFFAAEKAGDGKNRIFLKKAEKNHAINKKIFGLWEKVEKE